MKEVQHGKAVTRRTKGAATAMKHPVSRAERRHERQRIITLRRARRVCIPNWGEQLWQKYAKWNGDCGSPLCHSGKYFTEKRRRREALKRDVREGLKEVGQ